MKNNLLFIISILLFSCNSKPLDIVTTTDQQDDKKNNITKEQSSLIFDSSKTFPDQTQVSIALIKNGTPQYYGVKRINDTLVSTENYKSVFEIGSITKVFTATLLADLVLENKVKLDDSINQHLNFSLKDNQKITLKELANHTSGLPGMPTNFDIDLTNPNPFKHFNNEILREYLTDELSLSHSLLTKYGYSNLGAALLAYTLLEITHTDYATLLQNNIFSRYEMTKSTIKVDDVRPFLIQGLNRQGQPTPNWDLGALAGAGAIISSVEDLSKFAVAQFDNKNKELALTRERTYWISPINEVGLGWHVKKKMLRDDWYWHNGGTGGYSSCIVLNTVTQNSIIVLSNVSTFSSNGDKVDKICFDLMRTLESS